MIIDVRKKISALDVAKMESKEVQKTFLELGKTMAQWMDKYYPIAPDSKKNTEEEK